MTRDEYEGRIAELKARYPYLFAAPHVGRHVAPGWMSIVSDLCARIDGALTEAERPRVHFTQIREKYGSLRAYLNIAPLRVDIFGGVEGICRRGRDAEPLQAALAADPRGGGGELQDVHLLRRGRAAATRGSLLGSHPLRPALRVHL